MKSCYVLSIFILFWNSVNSDKILGIFPSPSYSQFILAEKLMGELANKGHKVTVISGYEPKINIEHYETVKMEKFNISECDNIFTWTRFSDYTRDAFFLEICIQFSEALLKQNRVHNLIHSNRTFDLVIVENFCNEAHMGFAEHFKAPLVVFSSQPIHEWNSRFVGNVLLPSITPLSVSSYSNHMNFIERFDNFILSIWDTLYKELRYFPIQQKLLNTYFPNQMDLKKVITSAEMMLLFSHPLITEPSLTTSAVVEIGGFHISPKKLPDHIQNFLDEATNGSILISLGTNINYGMMTKEKFDVILNVIGKLPQRVLWKCELDIFDKPENLLISNWLPQADILAHPNTIAFVTHSGLLSTTEAIYYGVPMISLPAFGDQPLNSARVVKRGMGIKLNFLSMSQKQFYEAIIEVINNPRYKTEIQKISKMLRDQPSNPLERALHTIEYVLKYKPGYLLRSSALDLWWIQLYSVDVLMVVFILFISLYLLLSLFFKKIYQKNHPKKIKQS